MPIQIIVLLVALTVVLGVILDNWKRFGLIISMLLAWLSAIALLAIILLTMQK